MLSLINVDPNYIEFLKQDSRLKNVMDSKIALSTNGGRKYIGVCITVNNYNYYVPIHKGSKEMLKKGKSYSDSNGIKKIKRSKFDVEFIETDSSGNEKLTSILKAAYMIPVPSCAIINYDINTEPNPKVKRDFTDLMNWCNKLKNTQSIMNRCSYLYDTKIKVLSNQIKELTENEINYSKYWLDYLLLQQKCDE